MTDVVRQAGLEAIELLTRHEDLAGVERLLEQRPFRGRVFQRIHRAFPHVPVDQIEAAWAYYLSHRDEVLALMAEEDQAWGKHAPDP